MTQSETRLILKRVYMQFQNFFTKNNMITADDRMGIYVKIALAFFITLILISVGYLLGVQKRQHMQAGSDQSVNANVVVTDESDLTKEIIDHLTNTSVEYGSWKSSARLYTPDELGFPSAYSSLLGIREVKPGIQIHVVSVSDETLHTMSDPEVQLPESLSGMYQQKPVLASTDPYGLLLVTPTSTLSRITWLSKINNQPVVFLVEFPQSSQSELVVRYTIGQSLIEFGDGMDEEQALFNHVLDLYPSDQKLTEDFHNNLRTRRDANHGYNFQDTVATDTNQGGNTFVLKQYNDKDVNSTGPCQGFTDPGERQDHAPSDSCEFTVSLSNGSTITLRDKELSVLGGVPKKWLNDTEILVEHEYCGGLGCDWRMVTGAYDVITKKSKTLVEQHTRCPWLGLSINFKEQAYILAAPEFEHSTSTLYKVNSGRTFEDFFVPTDRSDNHCGPHMVLNKSLLSELTSLADFPSVSFSDIDPKIIKQNPAQDAEMIFEGRNNNSFILK